MKNTSMERIDKKNKNHKQNVPSLRYGNFNKEWDEKYLKDICVINPKTEVPDYFNYIDLESVNSGILSDNKTINKVDAPSRAQRKLEKKDILFATVRPYQQNNFYFDLDGIYVASTGYAQIRAKYSSQYLYYFLHTKQFLNEVMKRCTGTSYPAINSNDLKTIKIKIPSIKEQEKIALFLSTIDQKIELMEKKYNNLINYKRSFIQSLPLNCRKDLNVTNWSFLKLSQLMQEHKEKSSGKEEVYSVSVYEGLINQIKHLGRSYSADDTSNYNLVKPGDIVYTKSPTGDFPLGIIKQSHLKKNVIVSPLYGVFTPNTYELGYILESFFESPTQCNNYLHPLVQKGAKNTMNITNKTFLSKEIYVPISTEEQLKIYNIIKSTNDKINLVRKEIQSNKNFKKTLLSKMFC